LGSCRDLIDEVFRVRAGKDLNATRRDRVVELLCDPLSEKRTPG
jgi:hypothetical protein